MIHKNCAGFFGFNMIRLSLGKMHQILEFPSH